MNHTITQQIQPTYNSCSSTCMAMILNTPVKEVIGEFHDKYIDDYRYILAYMSSKEIPFELCNVLEALEWGYLYIASVPSLNLKAVNHQILIDCREIGNTKLYDPNKGKDRKLYYVAPPNGDTKCYPKRDLGEYELGGYHLEFKIRGKINAL